MDREQQIIGHELLFRDGLNNAFPDVSDEYATSRILADRMCTLQRSTQDDQQHVAFINFPQQNLLALTPTLFPKDDFVIEILEKCTPNDALFDAIQTLFHKGYTLALDDFSGHEDWQRFLPYIHIIKFDLLLTPLAEAKVFMEKNRLLPIKYLAEKVETLEQFEQAHAAGFDYFQGYFFAKPKISTHPALSPSAMIAMQLFQAMMKPSVDFDEVEQIISCDVSISYKLLRFVNIMTTYQSKPITSFKQALVFLGEDNLKRFIFLIATAYVASDENSPLFSLSIQRARFCELIAPQLKQNCSEAFITGLFSLLECMLSHPIEQLVSQLPLRDQVKHALTDNRGPLGGIISLTKAYDHANWKIIKLICNHYRLEEQKIAEAYVNSLQWAKNFTATSNAL
ncbi:EAL and HDOD domain-containing protein [Thaumasiovibrio sp. DFM-14]|uniref:EAL and HDOD domain-containing protein n=1 Tax=Thaumasiovibrio sp. DFM-14 TaxID=3384792 RepID=UPI0039A02CA3